MPAGLVKPTSGGGRHGGRASGAAWALAVATWLCNAAIHAQAGDPASNQATAPGPVAPPESGQTLELERMRVTGYHIRRTHFEGPAPLLVFDRQELEQSGYSTLQDFLSHLTVNASRFNDSLGSNQRTMGATQVNLRGIGSDATLTLVDGMRIAPYGASAIGIGGGNGTEAFVDINSIPLSAIERVEILLDGASAIYGADAVAGVVNFVLRRDFTGQQFTLGYRNTTRWDHAERYADFLLGRGNGVSSIQLSLSWLNRDPLFSRQRSSTSDVDFTALGGPNLRSSAGSPPTLFIPATFELRADDACGTDPLLTSVAPHPLGSICRFNYRQFTMEHFGTERLGAHLRARSLVNRETELFADLFYNHNDTDNQLAPTPVFSSPGLQTVTGRPLVPADHPDNPLGVPLEVWSRPLDTGTRRFQIDTNSWRIAMGADGRLRAWDWRLALVASGNEVDLQRLDGVRVSRYQEALLGRGGPGANQYYNPFGFEPENAPELLDWLTTDLEEGGETREHAIEATFDRRLGKLAGGDAAVAVGVQARRQSLEEFADPLAQTGDIAGINPTEVVDESRDILSAYLETLLPLSRSLEAQLAVRWERYDDFGSETSPKLALRWKAGEDWALRSSWAESFRPPSFQELFDPTTLGFQFYQDVVRCPLTGLPQDCQFWEYRQERSGNPDLEPETGESLFLGFQWTPSWRPELSLSIDAWRFEHDERIILLDGQVVLDQGGSAGIVRAPPSEMDLAIGAPGRIELVRESYLNSDRLVTRGLDTQFAYAWATEGFGQFSLRLVHTYTDEFRFEASQAFGIDTGTDHAGGYLFGPIPEHRANLGLNWRLGHHSVAANVHYAGRYRNDLNEFEQGVETDRPWSIASFTTVDLQYGIEFPTWKSARLKLGCHNCLDEKPPVTFHTVTNYLHDARGAQVYVRWEQPL